MAILFKNAKELGTRRRSERHIPGEEGVWVFIFGDMMVFAVFFATFLYYRSEDVELFNRSAEQLRQAYGAINTLFLLTSSLFVIVGVRALRRHARNIAPWCFVGALVCGLGFSCMKFLEYGDKIDQNITPTTNDFWMYFYVLTGLHFFHLIVGMGVLIFLWMKSRKVALTIKEFAFVEGGACFWHMVDLLWIVLFPLLYFMR